MDTGFWDELLAGLDYADLEWLELRIQRRKMPLQSEIIARKTIIRKNE
jgi:hypothetical protein